MAVTIEINYAVTTEGTSGRDSMLKSEDSRTNYNNLYPSYLGKT